MNFVRQSTRLALYLRDGLACAWCGHALEDGAALSLDHLTPYSTGGSNAPANLVTACMRCNRARGARSVAQFARDVAQYLGHGARAIQIVDHVRATALRSLTVPRCEALAMIARRGSVAKVLATY